VCVVQTMVTGDVAESVCCARCLGQGNATAGNVTRELVKRVPEKLHLHMCSRQGLLVHATVGQRPEIGPAVPHITTESRKDQCAWPSC